MIFPTQIALDINEKGCQYGFIAYYDKSVSEEQVRAALNEHYPNATDPVGGSRRTLWRLEQEKVVIQLGTIDKRDQKMWPHVEIGTKQLIYLRISDTCRPRK